MLKCPRGPLPPRLDRMVGQEHGADSPGLGRYLPSESADRLQGRSTRSDRYLPRIGEVGGRLRSPGRDGMEAASVGPPPPPPTYAPVPPTECEDSTQKYPTSGPDLGGFSLEPCRSAAKGPDFWRGSTWPQRGVWQLRQRISLSRGQLRELRCGEPAFPPGGGQGRCPNRGPSTQGRFESSRHDRLRPSWSLRQVHRTEDASCLEVQYESRSGSFAVFGIGMSAVVIDS